MRITNSMAMLTQSSDIRRNSRSLNAVYQQIATGKKIQFPSDNPIAASRSLKYRTIVAYNEQFQRNVQSALSWTAVSESAITNIESIQERIRELCAQASNDTYSTDNRSAIATEIRQLIDQIGAEINQTYGDRYVFSGFRTDHPPILTQDNSNIYVISQLFDSKDIEKTKSYQKFDSALADEPLINNVNILKLAYKNVDFNFNATSLNTEDTEQISNTIGIFKPDGTPYNIVTTDSQDKNAYTPLDDGNTIHYIADKGELVFGDQVAAAFKDGTKVTYKKSDLKAGELNPVVYFDCKEIKGLRSVTIDVPSELLYVGKSPLESKEIFDILSLCTTDIVDTQGFYFNVDGKSYDVSLASFDLGHHMQKYYAENLALDENSTFNDFAAQMYNTTNPYNPDNPYSISPDNKAIFLQVLQGALIDGFANSTLTSPLASANPTVDLDASGRIEVRFSFTYDSADEPVFVGVSCTGAKDESYGHGFLHEGFDKPIYTPAHESVKNAFEDMTAYNMEEQYIEYQCSFNTWERVNSLAKNIYTDKMYADLLHLYDFVTSASISEYKDLEAKYSGEGHNLSGSTLTSAIDDQIRAESAAIRTVLQTSFNNILGLSDRHASNVSKEHSALGNRMSSFEFFSSQLTDERINYSMLLSENEDADLAEAIMKMNTAQSTYSAALKVIATIGQFSLVDYLR